MKINKKIDLAILILFPVIIAVMAAILKTNFLISTLLFFGLPSAWLIFRYPRATKKSFLFAILFTLPLVAIVDYIMVVSRGWLIVSSIFSQRFLGVVAWEQFIWGVLFVFFLLMFYEYFLDRPEKKSIFEMLKISRPDVHQLVRRAMQDFTWLLFFLFSLFIIAFLTEPNFLKIHYPYLIIGTIIVLLPLSLFLFKFPNFWLRFLKATCYFAYLAVVVEYIGVKLNHWIFPGQEYLSVLPFFNFLIPFEEYFFYIILSAAGILTYYEFFDDDKK
ncbi:MAG: hypothetical protein A2927_03360 [Candidatus Komeilibacteria bacterium RIFCSPLOWO2_01_FULL_45_10]|uniref:Lycopene cyclase domain-containing protein n=1 Tax=Candidatus Komeilibacteria bacterium RIFCSPLOWO2_01_FULL_45_10 TaxID=1798550 RepID=A0A1G2BN56_9BACT|nr:MAG: hypothetical protein A2927_03360 [Candidatus Komeilibacteria bacterium RIFCSPLOWO2_01_FULL_45_10]